MAEQITRAHTDPKTGKIKRMLALNEAARVGVSMEYMDKSIKQTYASSGNKLADEAKKAKNKDYKGIKYKEAPKDLTSHYLDLGTTDDEARSIWSRQYQKLRSADANDAEARNSLDQGTDYGIFETTWGNTELIDKDIADFQARKEMRAKKYR